MFDMKKYQADWYKNNRNRLKSYVQKYRLEHANVRERERVRRAKIREFINRLKCQPCMDCKVQYNPWVMQFDHRDPSEKKLNITRGMDVGKKRLLEEVKKCDIVCANCHAERTHSQRQKAVFA